MYTGQQQYSNATWHWPKSHASLKDKNVLGADQSNIDKLLSLSFSWSASGQKHSAPISRLPELHQLSGAAPQEGTQGTYSQRQVKKCGTVMKRTLGKEDK